MLCKLGCWCSDAPYGGAAEDQVASKKQRELEVGMFLPITWVTVWFGGADTELFKEMFIPPIAGKRNAAANT